MLRDHDLSFLRDRQFNIFKDEQDIYRSYEEAVNNTSYAFEAMNAAWIVRSSTREAMLRERHILEETTYRYEEHWHLYEVARDEIRHDINALKEYSNYQHQQLLRCRMQAEFEYYHGDKRLAKEFAQEGRKHKEIRNNTNSEIRQLIQDIKDLREEYEARDVPEPDSSIYREAREKFKEAKAHHDAMHEEYEYWKAERNRLYGKIKFMESNQSYKKRVAI